MGLIKFGSRVDLLVPEAYEVLVKKGDRVKNGATPLARPPGEPAK
jgi:phosphatidylserine decarboxylase